MVAERVDRGGEGCGVRGGRTGAGTDRAGEDRPQRVADSPAASRSSSSSFRAARAGGLHVVVLSLLAELIRWRSPAAVTIEASPVTRCRLADGIAARPRRAAPRACASRCARRVSTSRSIRAPVIARRSAGTVRLGIIRHFIVREPHHMPAARQLVREPLPLRRGVRSARAVMPGAPSSTRAPVPRGASSSSGASTTAIATVIVRVARRGGLRAGRGRVDDAPAHRSPLVEPHAASSSASHDAGAEQDAGAVRRAASARGTPRAGARRRADPRPAIPRGSRRAAAPPPRRASRSSRSGVAQAGRGEVERKARRASSSRRRARPAPRAAAATPVPMRRRTRSPSDAVGLRMSQRRNRDPARARHARRRPIARGDIGCERDRRGCRARSRPAADARCPRGTDQPRRRLARRHDVVAEPELDRPAPRTAPPRVANDSAAASTSRPADADRRRAGRRRDRMPRRRSRRCRRGRGRARRRARRPRRRSR